MREHTGDIHGTPLSFRGFEGLELLCMIGNMPDGASPMVLRQLDVAAMRVVDEVVHELPRSTALCMQLIEGPHVPPPDGGPGPPDCARIWRSSSARAVERRRSICRVTM
jgi:hypothetical protein